MSSPLIHTKFSELIKKLLKALDEYNTTDLTVSTDTVDQNTSGEIAGLAINLSLHLIYDLIKDSKYLDAYPTTNFSSIANQDYIDLDPEASLDEIESMVDTTNNLKLNKRSWSYYKRYYSSPSQITGVPVDYIRRGNRVYLGPRPTSVISYLTDFRKFTGDLKLAGDLPLIPTHYDYWIIAESKVKYFEHLDATSVPITAISERNDARKIAMDSITSDYDSSLQSFSHMNRGILRVGAWDRL